MTYGTGILTCFPFEEGGINDKLPTREQIKSLPPHINVVFPLLLGPTILRTIAVSAKPFSTTVFKILA